MVSALSGGTHISSVGLAPCPSEEANSGAADVSTVLAGIQWVVSFKDTYGVRVLNLSVGTDSTQSWEQDPLNYAVERAWDAGSVDVGEMLCEVPRVGGRLGASRRRVRAGGDRRVADQAHAARSQRVAVRVRDGRHEWLLRRGHEIGDRLR